MKTNHTPRENWRDALRESWASDAPSKEDLARLWSGVEAKAARVLASHSRPVPSPWFAAHAKLATSLAVVALVIGTGGIGAAAETALPGDFLYPMKTEVNEAAMEILAVGPEANAQAKVEIVHRRTEEVRALADEGRLDAESAAEIAINIQAHAAEAAEAAIALGAAQGDDVAEAEAAVAVVSEQLAFAVGESAQALDEALIALAPPAADARITMMSVVADEPATTTDDAANDGDDSFAAKVAPEADQAQTDESAPTLSPEEAAQISQASVDLSLLSQTLDAIGEEPAEPVIDLPVAPDTVPPQQI
jgi:hypothetical protein